VTSTLLQGDQVPGPSIEPGDTRRHFHEFALANFDPGVDRVILIEPNPARHPGLVELWRDWTQVELRTATLLPGFDRWYRCSAGGPLLAPDPAFVRAHHPADDCLEVPVAVDDLAALAAAAGGLAFIAVDARFAPGMLDQDWANIDARSVSVELPTSDGAAVRALTRRLRGAGWRRAGRAWGPAGSSALWRRGGSAADRVRDAVASARVDAGSLVVTARDRLPLGERARALRLRVATTVAGRRADVLDPAFGVPHEPLSAESVRTQVQAWVSASDTDGRWELEDSAFTDPEIAARECHNALGIWPITFSYPGELLPLTWPRETLISPMIPGFPYAFDDPGAYLRTYARAALAVTHRKAGWDCFRHVEILAAGALPLMVDANNLPRFCMVHHPHRALREILGHVRAGDGWPSSSSFERMRAHTEQHLTSGAMADYLLRMAGLTDAQRILFVDRQHPASSDYQSTLALIGLKQRLGARVESMFPAPWIHTDDTGPSQHLYGRGFGYTRTVDPSARSAAEARTGLGDRLHDLDLSQFDAVVVGSCSRNRELAQDLLRQVAPERTVWIHGEDTPPLPDDVRWIRNCGVHAFVRAIER